MFSSTLTKPGDVHRYIRARVERTQIPTVPRVHKHQTDAMPMASRQRLAFGHRVTRRLALVEWPSVPSNNRCCLIIIAPPSHYFPLAIHLRHSGPIGRGKGKEQESTLRLHTALTGIITM